MTEKTYTIDASRPLDFMFLLSFALSITFFYFAIISEQTVIPTPMGRVIYFFISLLWWIETNNLAELMVQQNED